MSQSGEPAGPDQSSTSKLPTPGRGSSDQTVDRTVPGLAATGATGERKPAPLPSVLEPLGPIGKHPWTRVPVGDLPYIPYCTVCSLKALTADGQAYAYGSGVMIGRRTVLTARHCVLIDDPLHGGRARWVQVTPARGYNELLPYPEVLPFQTIVSTSFEWDSYHDFAVILLAQEPLENKQEEARPLRARMQYAFYPNVSLNQVIVHNLGYPGVHPTTTEVLPRYKSMWKGIGQVTGVGVNSIDYDIDTNEGNSGSPIFLRLSNGDPRQDEYHIIGIHVEDHSAAGFNRGVRITSLVCDRLDEWRRSHDDLTY